MHFGRPVQPLSNIYLLAGSLLQEFLEAQNSVPTVIRPPIQRLWRPPDQARYKVNIDAAVFKPSNSAGIGVIARNWRGEAIGALSLPIPWSLSVADMEARL